MSTKNEVKVIGFITNDVKDFHSAVPDDFLSADKKLPKSLIEELKANGWRDTEGTIWWSPDFKPSPVRGDDGHVYLCVSDADTADSGRLFARLNEARRLLDSRHT